jgi:NOL1/NOP2/sun family putative RNA methylase
MPGKRFFLERYRRMGHDLSGDERTSSALRINTLKTDAGALVERLSRLGATLERVSYLRDGYTIERSGFSLGASFEYLLGLYALQEAASQFAVEVLRPERGETILDMCAAPGTKTSQISAHMGNTGAVVAVDVSRGRLYALENNLERMGVVNCAIYHADANELDYGGLLFDRVLLDAPCSGNYVADGAWFSKRRPRDFEGNAERQRRLLGTAVGLLRPGGVLVYTTCSLEPEEDELNVQWLLDNHDVSLDRVEGPGSPGLTEALGERLDDEVGRCMRFWPDETGTQGFFVARVRA